MSPNQQKVKTPRISIGVSPVIWGATDVGREREDNQDAIYPQSNGQGFAYTPNEASLTRKGHLLIVADGIGGSQAGGQASQWVIRSAVEKYYELRGEKISQDLELAVNLANKSLYQYMQDTATPDAGCTIAAAVIHGNMLYVANVGDSRVYLIRQGRIYKLTRDHTLTQQKIDQGLLDPAFADSDASRSILTRSLGALPTVQVDVFSPTPLLPGDLIILCSDGLYDMVREDEIAQLGQRYSPEKTARRLIKTANRRGGLDNISIVVARIPGKSINADVTQSVRCKSSRIFLGNLSTGQRRIVLLLSILILAVFVLMGWTISKSVFGQKANSDESVLETVLSPIEVVPTTNGILEVTLTPQPISPSKATSTPRLPSTSRTSMPEPTEIQETTDLSLDSDGDRIIDTIDVCPYQAGPSEYRGCPDSDGDGDGVADPDDECPDEGLAAKAEDRAKPLIQGCLDTDQDGFPNKSDTCPSIWASADTDGCPIASSGDSDEGKNCSVEPPDCTGTLVCTNGEWKCLVVNE